MTASASVVDLKPCPFCGGAASTGFRYRDDALNYSAGCRNAQCILSVAYGNNEREAASAWNQRATPQPAEQDAREAVARAIEYATAKRDIITKGQRADLRKTLRALLALAQAAPDGWRPIETAPKDGTPVDLLIGGERWPEYSWCERCNAWTKEVGYPTRTSVITTNPTHYFVVPAPPAQGAGL